MNYCAQAQPDLLRIANGFASLVHSRSKTPQVLRDVVAGLQRAVKFKLPDGGRYFETSELDDSVFECLHLPYPVVALEADVSVFGDERLIQSGPLKEMMSSRRIVLCRESNASFKLDHQAEASLVEELGPGIFFQVVFYSDDAKFWSTNSMGAFLPRRNSVEQLSTIEETWVRQVESQRQTENGVSYPKTTQSAVLRPILLLPELFFQLEQELGLENARQRAHMDFQDEFVMLLQFCIMLSCQNVTTHTQPQTTEAKNAKRIRHGKLPLYEYKILELKSNASGQSSGDAGGTHESPRCHLRRGHIRRLESERRIWVRAAVVGNPHRGVIEKEYDARQSL